MRRTCPFGKDLKLVFSRTCTENKTWNTPFIYRLPLRLVPGGPSSDVFNRVTLYCHRVGSRHKDSYSPPRVSHLYKIKLLPRLFQSTTYTYMSRSFSQGTNEATKEVITLARRGKRDVLQIKVESPKKERPSSALRLLPQTSPALSVTKSFTPEAN